MKKSEIKKINLSLLYIEDDDLTREQLTEVFKLKMQHVYIARDGKEALEIFKTHKIDIVISDYKMPKMNGNTLCEAIKKFDKNVPFILLTAYRDTSLLLGAIEAGVDKFMQKPVDAKELFFLLDKICEEKHKAFELERSRIYLKETEKLAHISYWSANLQERGIKFSEEAQRLFLERTPESGDVNIEEMARAVIEDDREKFLEIFNKLVYEKKSLDTIFSIVDRTEEQRYIHLLMKRYVSEVSGEEEVVGIFQDVSRYEKEKAYLIERVNSDPFLPVANKAFLIKHLHNLIKHAHISNDIIGVLFFDVDNFKQINDTYGHMVADELLFELTTLIKKNIRKSDLLGRWGGDEFVIVTADKSLGSVVNLAKKLTDLIANHTWKHDTKLTVSVGVKFYEKGMSAEELIKKADEKMYEAKKDGKNRFRC